MPAGNRNTAAMICKLFDSLLLSVMLLIGAKLTTVFSSLEVVFLVNLLGAFLGLLIFSIIDRNAICPRCLRLHIYRGVLGVVSTACFLLSLQHLGLAESTAINFFAPVITALVSKVRHKEVFDRATAGVLAINFASVVFVLSERFEPGNMTAGAIESVGYSLVSMSCMVLYNLNMRKIGQKEPLAAQSIFGAFVSALLLMPFMISRLNSMSDRFDWQCGLLLTIYSALLIAKSLFKYISFKFGDLSKIMSLDYAQVIFTAALATVFLNQKITLREILGAAAITFTGCLQIYFSIIQKGKRKF